MAPMATNYASESGGVTETLIDYYEARAKGGAGLIIVENCCVDYPGGKSGALCPLQPNLLVISFGGMEKEVKATWV